MEPKPMSNCPTPTQAIPSSRRADSTVAKCSALTGADRHAPLAEQEALLAPTPAMRGQPVGTALSQIKNATDAARRGARVTPNNIAQIGTANATYGEGARVVQSYIPDLEHRKARPGQARTLGEARLDYASYRDAEVGTAVLSGIWAGALAVSDVSDIKYEATMGSLEASGLAPRNEEGHRSIDRGAVDGESAVYSDALAEQGTMLRAPRTDGGPIANAVADLGRIGLGLASAVTKQRVLMLEAEAEEVAADQRSHDDRNGLLEDIARFMQATVSVVMAPSPASGAAFGIAVGSLLDNFGSPSELEARASALARSIHDERERGGWLDLAAAVSATDAARRALSNAVATLESETGDTTTELAEAGGDADRAQERPGQRRGARPAIERNRAMGAHLGKLLELQRFESAACDAIGAVGPVMSRARDASDVASAGLRADPVLAGVKERMGQPANLMSALAALRAQIEARHVSRLAAIAQPIKTVVSDLSSLADPRLTEGHP